MNSQEETNMANQEAYYFMPPDPIESVQCDCGDYFEPEDEEEAETGLCYRCLENYYNKEEQWKVR